MPHDPADETTQDLEQTPPEAPPAPAQAAPTPSYVTLDAFMQFQENVFGMLQRNQQPQQTFTQEPQIQEPTDDEFDTAALEGKGVGRAVKRAIAAAEARVRRDAGAEVEQVRGVGLPALAEQAYRLAKQGWEPEFYEKHKREIDQGIAQLPPELKASPEKLDLVYNLVWGMHRKEVIAAEREKAIRQSREPQDDQPARGNKTSRTTSADEIPDDRELFGAESVAGLRSLGRGRTIDDIARKLGYDDPAKYRAKVLKYQREQRGAA